MVENAIKINAGKSKSISLTKARVKDPLNYYFGVGGKEFRKRTTANI